MKNVFKTIVFAAAFCLFAACQQELIPQEKETPAGELTITASRASLTKVEYAEDGGTHNLVGSWEVGDVIFGFTGAGATVSFSVASVDGVTGVATLSQTTSVELANGDVVHVIHCPGKTASDLSEQTLAVDFSSQAENVIPVLLLSTATVAENKLAFSFTNAVSIVGVKNPVFKKTTTATKLLSITLSGHEIVSSGVVSLSGGNLVFTGNAPDKFITKAVNATPNVAGDEFTIDDPVYIVVPAGPIANVSAIDNKSNFFVYSLNQTADVSKYYVLNGKSFPAVTLPTSSKVSAGGVLWAKTNLGTDSVTGMGDIYRWSDTGKIYTERDGTTAVLFDSGHTGGFNAYNGECYYTTTPSAKYTKYTKADNKLVLDPVDDVVQLTFPGSGWRMPTLAEFNALFETGVTHNSGTGNNVGTTITIGGNSVFLRSTATVCAPSSKDKTTIGKKGRYWASSIQDGNKTTTAGNPDYIQLNGDGTQDADPTASVAGRHSGFLIRPVRE